MFGWFSDWRKNWDLLSHNPAGIGESFGTVVVDWNKSGSLATANVYICCQNKNDDSKILQKVYLFGTVHILRKSPKKYFFPSWDMVAL